MSGNRKNTAIASDWSDPDDAAELTDDFFQRAEHTRGHVVIRRGRPPIEWPKQAVSIRLDPDVLAHFKNMGPGWQTRINDTLRRVMVRAKSKAVAR